MIDWLQNQTPVILALLATCFTWVVTALGAAVVFVEPLLPYALSFAAGAMIFVVVEELIPESQMNKNTDLATLMTLLGFTVMMILDVALG